MAAIFYQQSEDSVADKLWNELNDVPADICTAYNEHNTIQLLTKLSA